MTTKVARLMLASDVLHNSTAPVRNASRYRSLLEASLPDAFESLQAMIPACTCSQSILLAAVYHQAHLDALLDQKDQKTRTSTV